MSPFPEPSSHLIFLACGIYSLTTLIVVLCVHILSNLLCETVKAVSGEQQVRPLPNVALYVVGVQSRFLERVGGWMDGQMDRWMDG